jgi:hypothetical protein
MWSTLFWVSGGKKRVPEYRSKKFNIFTLKNIPFQFLNSTDELNDFDYIFIGSDQIWNAEIVTPTEFEYGQMADSDRVICISPSFGVEGFSKEIEQKIAGYLQKLNHLNVREHSGANIIKRLTGKDVPVFIDPTLMLDASDWEKLEKKPKNLIGKKKYILKYFLGDETQESIDDTEMLARENDLEVIKFLDKSDLWAYVTGPAEFLYLIHNAEIVLTDSFHACVFSILFRRPFWAYSRTGEKMNSRLDTLFKILNLDNRFEHNKNKPFEIDYSRVDGALHDERAKVNSFLEEIIGKGEE